MQRSARAGTSRLIPWTPSGGASLPVTHLINATLDGRCDHRHVVADDDLHAHAHETIADADAILFGSGTYRLLAPHWSQVAEAQSSTPVINAFASELAAK